MRRRKDPLLAVGFVYLALLLVFALAGPWARSASLSRALGTSVNAVYDPVAQPHLPPRAQLTSIQDLRLRSGPEGPVVIGADPGTAARESGLRSGAVVLSIDGTALAGRPLGDASGMLQQEGDARTLRVRFTDGTERDIAFVPLSGVPAPVASLPFGTDEQGRDIVARLAQGARISLMVGLIVQMIALTVGVTVGVLGVYAPRWVGMPLMRLTDGMFAFPDILLAILIIGVMQSAGISPVVVALSITAWPSIARLVKTQAATLKDREFVIAAKASGATAFYQVTRHVLPQLWGILLAVSMIEVAGTILAESTLSFLGIGVQAPDPSWGSMINNARSDMNSHPSLLLWPCLILSATIFALNFVGDGVRTWLDPKSK